MKTIVTAVILTFAMIFNALAVECPPGMARCKVLTISPEEEQALTAPNGILATAEQGRFIDLNGAVKYFREKIASAPLGEIHKSVPLPTPKPDANGNPTENKSDGK